MAALTFTSRRSIAPMMWVLLALSVGELVVVHLLVAHWTRVGALAISAVTVSVVAYLAGGIASLGTRPSTIEGDRVLLRAGYFKAVTFGIDRVAAVRPAFDAAAVKRRGCLNLALVAWPNVYLDLAEPIARGRRRIDAVAHRLDDPVAFLAALDTLRRRDD